jgi:hypothetical protein
MIVLDLFAGTGSSTLAFERAGCAVFKIELDPQHQAELHADILTLSAADLIALCGGRPDFIWASPPCTAFSVASIGHHWGGGFRAYQPKTEAAALGLRVVAHTLALIREINPPAWIVENPRGVLRKLPVMRGIDRRTVSYCSYGDERMKPTDLWGGFPEGWIPRPMCKNGDTCHEAAPRGAKTGTQGRDGAVDRSRVPYQLSEDLCRAVMGLPPVKVAGQQAALTLG